MLQKVGLFIAVIVVLSTIENMLFWATGFFGVHFGTIVLPLQNAGQ
jgi:hypothetical protein